MAAVTPYAESSDAGRGGGGPRPPLAPPGLHQGVRARLTLGESGPPPGRGAASACGRPLPTIRGESTQQVGDPTDADGEATGDDEPRWAVAKQSSAFWSPGR